MKLKLFGKLCIRWLSNDCNLGFVNVWFEGDIDMVYVVLFELGRNLKY